MKTHAIPISRSGLSGHSPAVRGRGRFAIPYHPLLATLAAVLPAAAITVLAVVGFSLANPAPAAATLWVTAFAFLALAVENQGHRAAALGLTGAALMLLAGLSTGVAVEFGIFAGLVIAAWVATAILGHMLHIGRVRTAA